MFAEGKGVAYGAITIINALSCGLGAALGICLETEATVQLNNNPGHIEGRIVSDPDENISLIHNTVSKILQYFHVEEKYGAYVETRSNIPIARGLKSSSVAANAISLAVFAALDKNVQDLTLINLGVDAALDSGVTITGAFDDACASYFGGIVVTDNNRRKILRQYDSKDEYSVVIHVPNKKVYTVQSDVKSMSRIAKEVEALHKLAYQGDYWPAMTLNGLAYSVVLGYDTSMTLEALEAGAIAAGLSGKGPSTAAVVPKSKVDEIKNAWKGNQGYLIETLINTKKAHIVI